MGRGERREIEAEFLFLISKYHDSEIRIIEYDLLGGGEGGGGLGGGGEGGGGLGGGGEGGGGLGGGGPREDFLFI